MNEYTVSAITAHAEDAGWGRVQVTVHSIDEGDGDPLVLRLGADGATWGWHPVMDNEDVFTFRMPREAAYAAMVALFAHIDPQDHTAPAGAKEPPYKRLYDTERARVDRLLDAVLKGL